MNILITGGAGYIGSHTYIELKRKGYRPIIVDNFSNSKIEVINSLREIIESDVDYFHLDILDTSNLVKIIKKYSIESVIHFAGLKSVSESLIVPAKYYHNNFFGTLSLIDAMNVCGVKKIIFSSSATVYGNKNNPVNENSSLNPLNPYGKSKYFVEQFLNDFSFSNRDWSIVILRYFNPVGAHKSSLIGEDPLDTPVNLMPILNQVASKKMTHINIYGDDYDTFDGSCIRDFIHVTDLSLGHIAALEYLNGFTGIDIFNLGTGKGTSVFELISTFEKVTKIKIPQRIVSRREGDIESSFADTTKANKHLSWKANLTLSDMCIDSWNWGKRIY